ncbi:hypothetical protein OG218_01865 [Kineococcus sp. NBC_00420]|uniref:carbonic anhydrase n=1 Tax=Kineococcus sp. NBC_00420 TaxID=2903564 RepID=UPI002E241C80
MNLPSTPTTALTPAQPPVRASSPTPHDTPDTEPDHQLRATADTLDQTGDRRSAAWIRLQQGNHRWAHGESDAGLGRGVQRRADLVSGQTPFAMILSCADSRVPAELVFDQGLGDLFVVRTAGHALDDTVLGSLEYAVSILGVDLVLVMGHQGCGAVAAAAQAVTGGAIPGGHIRGLVERLSLNITAAHHAGFTEGHDLARWHAAATLEQLQQRSSVLSEAVFHTRVGVMAATYELTTGLVVPVPARRPVPTAEDVNQKTARIEEGLHVETPSFKLVDVEARDVEPAHATTASIAAMLAASKSTV